jgi:hypothetical protein
MSESVDAFDVMPLHRSFRRNGEEEKRLSGSSGDSSVGDAVRLGRGS